LLTINQGTRRITGSIQHVADVPPEEFAQYAPDVADVLGTVGEAIGR
jgi:hypothetical protein